MKNIIDAYSNYTLLHSDSIASREKNILYPIVSNYIKLYIILYICI